MQINGRAVHRRSNLSAASKSKGETSYTVSSPTPYLHKQKLFFFWHRVTIRFIDERSVLLPYFARIRDDSKSKKRNALAVNFLTSLT
jgi:hypothetical protein